MLGAAWGVCLGLESRTEEQLVPMEKQLSCPTGASKQGLAGKSLFSQTSIKGQLQSQAQAVNNLGASKAGLSAGTGLMQELGKLEAHGAPRAARNAGKQRARRGQPAPAARPGQSGEQTAPTGCPAGKALGGCDSGWTRAQVCPGGPEAKDTWAVSALGWQQEQGSARALSWHCWGTSSAGAALGPS